MATMNNRRIALVIHWDKDDPTNFTYFVTAVAAITDDSKDGGEELLSVHSTTATLDRTTFRALTGAQIETSAKTMAADALDLLGSGAGAHTINDDTGS